MKSDVTLNEKEKTKLLKHPRLVELYIVQMYDMFYDRMGDERTLSIFRTICSMYTIDFDRVRLLLSRYHLVKAMQKTNPQRYYKELTLLGAVHGRTRYWVAEKWLHISKAHMYGLTPGISKEVITEESFLKSMEGEAVLSASGDIYRELLRFQDALRELSELFG